MRTITLATLMLIGASSPASAFSGSYAGCDNFGLCASVQLSAQQRPDGTWQLTMVIRNTSYGNAGATPQSRASGIRSFYLGNYPQAPITNPGGVTSVLDQQGNDTGILFNPDGGVDKIGADGFTEVLDSEGNIAHLSFGAVIDPRCAADPACAALRPKSTPTITYVDFPGTIVATFSLRFLPPTIEVWVSGAGETEAFKLTPVVATPEPLTMTMVATGLGLLGAARARRKWRRV
jgi:hypothetical protein